MTSELAALPPLVFAGECELLTERLAAVTRERPFVLHGAVLMAEVRSGGPVMQGAFRGGSKSRPGHAPWPFGFNDLIFRDSA